MEDEKILFNRSEWVRQSFWSEIQYEITRSSSEMSVKTLDQTIQFRTKMP